MTSPNSIPARKHVPVRMCVICRDKAGKRTLTRVVRTEQGLQVDPSGKLNGRGAYLCDRESCWETAVKTDLLAKALRMSLTEEDRERLRRARA
jgi:predicted RNA-binding protein YlxR (DUF448 family)